MTVESSGAPATALAVPDADRPGAWTGLAPGASFDVIGMVYDGGALPLTDGIGYDPPGNFYEVVRVIAPEFIDVTTTPAQVVFATNQGPGSTNDRSGLYVDIPLAVNGENFFNAYVVDVRDHNGEIVADQRNECALVASQSGGFIRQTRYGFAAIHSAVNDGVEVRMHCTFGPTAARATCMLNWSAA